MNGYVHYVYEESFDRYPLFHKIWKQLKAVGLTPTYRKTRYGLN